MSVFLSDVLVFLTCQMKMHQLCVWSRSHFEHVRITLLPTVRKPLVHAQNSTPQEILAGPNQRGLANFSIM